MSALLRPLGWAMGLGCCVAAIYAAAGAALERPDVLRLGAAGATSPSTQADYSVDPEQVRRPPLDPQIFGAIAVDELALAQGNVAAGAEAGVAPPAGVTGEDDDDHAPEATNTPRVASTNTPDRDSTDTPTPNGDATATKTPTAEPTATHTPAPKPTETSTPAAEPTSTSTPQHTPTRTPTPTKTPVPTKTPKHAPTTTNTPQTEPTATNTPTRCRKADFGPNQHGGPKNGKKRGCPTPTPTPDSPNE